MMGTSVKSERPDDHEINQMAKKIIEQNRNKVNNNLMVPAGQNLNPLAMQLARPGQPTIQQFMGVAGLGADGLEQNSKAQDLASEKKLDGESKKGRFGWCEFEKNHIPFIFRGNGERYTSVRMVERKFLSRFLAVLPPEVNSCHCIRSYYITENESKLLNEVNLKHSDCAFGKDAFTTKDLVVKLKDAKEFYRFLDLCYKKLVLKKSNASDRCGFFRINGESVVPYTVRDNVKFVPLFYFEGETDHLKLKSDSVKGWDLAYLKFCCKVQGIRNELFASDECRVVALDEIKGHFPPGTTFEDYWPAKGSIEPVNTQRTSAGNWTQKPAQSSSVPGLSNGVLKQQSSSSSQYNHLAGARQQTSASTNPYDSHQQLLNNPNYQQLMRASLSQMGMNNIPAAHQSYSPQQPQQQQHHPASRQFPTKLTQIKEFQIERSNQPPYKLQKALIDQKIVPCINVRPYVFHDLMMTLPDFVKHFCTDLSLERSIQMLQKLNVVLYKGNKGHQEILRSEGKCQQYDPVPLVLVKDIMNYMTQIKYVTSIDQQAKRMRVQ